LKLWLIFLENILLADKKNLDSIKICDFGLSAQYEPMQHRSNFTARCGTKHLWLQNFSRKKHMEKY